MKVGRSCDDSRTEHSVAKVHGSMKNHSNASAQAADMCSDPSRSFSSSNSLSVASSAASAVRLC
eukprot:5085242-Pleurochrysis_carterae.AAC.1